MRKILLLMLIALPVLAGAQSYSRWNYSDSQPNNATADAAMVAFYAAAMENHGQGEVKLFKSYRYPAATDSSFALPDVDAQVIRMFDPTPAPDGATELAREDTVIILTKRSPLKKRVMVGGDGILPPGQSIRPLDTFTAIAARKEAVALRKAVNDSIKANPSAGNTKAKRAKVWKAVKAKKDKKNSGKASANKAKCRTDTRVDDSDTDATGVHGKSGGQDRRLVPSSVYQSTNDFSVAWNIYSSDYRFDGAMDNLAIWRGRCPKRSDGLTLVSEYYNSGSGWEPD